MDDPYHYLTLAARLALRGMGHVEPNPMVGAVIVKDGRIIGLGHHRKFGDLHAEREALESCRRQGHDPRGSTIYVTLEPCSHHGKQPPCTDALIAAGVARVVAATRDPNPQAAGGAEVLHRAGITVEFSDASPLAAAVSLPFIKHVTTDLPFVIAKWAQTHDGRLITRAGEPRWISGPRARRRVHALRGRVDAVLTGIGTVLHDNPRLTARDVAPRRVAQRVILDTHLRTPPTAAIFGDASHAPVLILTTEHALRSPRADALRAKNAALESVPAVPDGVDLRSALRTMRHKHGVHIVMIEAGPALLASLFTQDLIDAALVHVAPGITGPPDLKGPRVGPPGRFAVARARAVGLDVEFFYLCPTTP